MGETDSGPRKHKLTWQFGKTFHRSVFPPATQQTVNLSDTSWWHHRGGEWLVPTIRFTGRSSNPSPSPSSTYSLSPFLLEMYTNRHCTLPDQVKQYLPEHCWAMLSFVTVRFIARQCLRSSCNFRWNCVCLLTKRPGNGSDSTLICAFMNPIKQVALW